MDNFQIDNLDIDKIKVLGCHALLTTKEMDLYTKDPLSYDRKLLEKYRIPIRLWIRNHGEIYLEHYCTKQNLDSIMKQGINKEYFSDSSFDEETKGLYCVKQSSDKKSLTLYHVLNDYPEYDNYVRFKYIGEYYEIINGNEDYIFVTEDRNISNLTGHKITNQEVVE